ncbi:hypothetical protein ACO2Q2_14840 [Dyella sp. KRB-257]|uniref:hypothetical protein n=1 Tax=Dyella sp. KRB-257 TaxID=3400915 RepID=UPI003C00B402
MQTRRLLKLVRVRSAAQAIPRDAARFTRRELREAVGWGDTQVKLHPSRLVEHEHGFFFFSCCF